MAQQNMEVVSAAFEAFRKLAVSQTKRPMRLRNRTSIPGDPLAIRVAVRAPLGRDGFLGAAGQLAGRELC